MGTILRVEAGAFGCGCDSAVGGISPQIRGESLVFGETEGELRRERDLGSSTENGVSIFVAYIATFLPQRYTLRQQQLFWTLHLKPRPVKLSFFLCVQ